MKTISTLVSWWKSCFLNEEILIEIELRDLSQLNELQYFKGRTTTRKINMNNQMMNLSEVTKFVLENNWDIALSNMSAFY